MAVASVARVRRFFSRSALMMCPMRMSVTAETFLRDVVFSIFGRLMKQTETVKPLVLKQKEEPRNLGPKRAKKYEITSRGFKISWDLNPKNLLVFQRAMKNDEDMSPGVSSEYTQVAGLR